MTATPPTTAEAARPLTTLLADLEASHRSLGMERVRSWKAAAPERRAIGCLPVFAPREVLWAAGALPVFIRGGGDQLETIRGDAYYQSYICRLPRSTLELGLGGWLDALDGMIFPNTCDVIRNLSGVWSSLFPAKLTRFLDPPQAGDQAAGIRFWRSELSALYRDVCALSGREPAPEALRAAILAYHQARRAARRLEAARIETPWRFPVDETYLLRRAGDVMPPLEWARLVDDYLVAAGARTVRPEDRIRVLVQGAFCEQPPLGLLRALERAGCYVIADDLTLGHLDSDDPDPDPGLDPLQALAEAEMVGRTASAVRYDAQGDRGRCLAAEAKRLHADGIIFAAPSFCDPALLDQPRLTKALGDAQVPYTAFKYAENTGQFQSIREQAGTFADSVKLWGHA
ncbi:MAG: 2-hydroxyacyl-CoA dehydratase [Deltaproteobacteria bacterium]|nr:2-hydroxyacyl-CoA dehydratase [Deltaproteobacteria bacterium]